MVTPLRAEAYVYEPPEETGAPDVDIAQLASIWPPRLKLLRPSKLEVPRPRDDAIERERLLRAIEEHAAARIVVLSASAGYGKTTLAAQWARRCGRPVVWINVDESDNDPIVFFGALVRALSRIGPLDPLLLREFRRPAPRIAEVVLPALAAELDRLAPLQLILDDAHELRGADALAGLASLLDDIRPPSQVVVASRGKLAWPLARRRVAGEVIDIGADVLALDLDETRAMAGCAGADLADDALEVLHCRTEGWPAGTSLALRALDPEARSESQAPTDFAHRLMSCSDSAVAEYIAEVVLDHESEERRRFLLATSVLTELTPPLCDAVVGKQGSEAVLTDLERRNSFVIALDDRGSLFRYHNLLAELLRSELERVDPDLGERSLLRAAQWYEQNDQPAEAFRCARECGNLKLAGRIALTCAEELVSRGQLETLRLWIYDCSDQQLESDAQLAIVAGWLEFFLGNKERAERFVRAAEQFDLGVPGADGSSSLRASLANLRATLASAGIHQMLAEGQLVCDAEQESGSTRMLVGGLRSVATALLLLDRLDEAVETFREVGVLTQGRADLAHLRVPCLAYLAFALAAAGDWAGARKAARDSAALAAEQNLERTVLGSVARTARALTLAHDGDFHHAAAELTEARSAGSVAQRARWLDADLNLRWGDLSLDIGDRRAAQGHADAARAALRGYPDPGALQQRLVELDRRIESLRDLHFTRAEMRIIPFLPTHVSIKEIAIALHVSAATVKTHVSSIYAKLSVPTRSDAVAAMADLGVLVALSPRDEAEGPGA